MRITGITSRIISLRRVGDLRRGRAAAGDQRRLPLLASTRSTPTRASTATRCSSAGWARARRSATCSTRRYGRFLLGRDADGARASLAGPAAPEPPRVQPDRHAPGRRSTSRSGTSAARPPASPSRGCSASRASTIPTYATAITVNPTPEQVYEEAQLRVRQGYRGFKIQFWDGLERDIPRFRAAREAVGPDFPLFQDAAGFYSWTEALGAGYVLDELNYRWFEEPLPDRQVFQLKRLADEIRTPVLTTETLAAARDAGGHAHRRRPTSSAATCSSRRGITGLRKAAARRRAVRLQPRDPRPRRAAARRREPARRAVDRELRVLRGPRGALPRGARRDAAGDRRRRPAPPAGCARSRRRDGLGLGRRPHDRDDPDRRDASVAPDAPYSSGDPRPPHPRHVGGDAAAVERGRLARRGRARRRWSSAYQAAGLPGAYCTGTDGEFHTLELDEFRPVIDAFAAAAARVGLPIQAGTGWVTQRGADRADAATPATAASTVSRSCRRSGSSSTTSSGFAFYRGARGSAVPDVGHPRLQHRADRAGCSNAAQIRALGRRRPVDRRLEVRRLGSGRVRGDLRRDAGARAPAGRRRDRAVVGLSVGQGLCSWMANLNPVWTMDWWRRHRARRLGRGGPSDGVREGPHRRVGGVHGASHGVVGARQAVRARRHPAGDAARRPTALPGRHRRGRRRSCGG